ncbi:hypothetical protein EJ04DRAFT_597851 [Polyplosphaeria fusca]|uniref:Nephrocystin 3-like N-terminal domain-containing protein n=1 Tax=Polyplosphaeria fusca TaxID=682080 RepID=A0A9P4R9X8_9PLEO|nr:hypothetical protein EJ04DRAFT_597851 [Polyplosphaeria fusca]
MPQALRPECAQCLHQATDTKLVKIRHWIARWSAPDPSPFHTKAQARRLQGTGQSLLLDERYTEWKRDTNSLIWLSGIPGSGKSVLVSGVIDDLQSYCRQDVDRAVAFFYFDFNDTLCRQPDAMVRSLIKQLFSQCVKVPTGLEAHYSTCADSGQQPPTASALEVLRILIRSFQHTYLVLDALDESPQREELLGYLATMVEWKLDCLHLAVASRQEQDIEEKLMPLLIHDNNVILRNIHVDEDIRTYVKHQLALSR